MFGLGQTELLVILLIVVLLFGAGRIGQIAGELGAGIRAFKSEISEDKKPE
jgi:sec-independent protein translocase protein TatA